MILISINFHFLCIGEYESMLVQAGSFWITFSLLETVVRGNSTVEKPQPINIPKIYK